MTNIRFHQTVEAFQALVGPVVSEREAENCLLIGILSQLATRKSTLGADPALLVSLHEGTRLIGAAVRMSAVRPLVLTQLPSDAVQALVGEVYVAAPELAGVMAPVDTAEEFASTWAISSGKTARVFMANRVFQLDAVCPPCQPPGSLRVATRADLADVVAMVRGFCLEALGDSDDSGLELQCGEAIEVGRYYVWQAGTDVVSMAATSGPTPNGIRITTVYTPPVLRGRGYASACVAALSQRMLNSGKRFCFLFTDLLNPTSNAIYQKIGYRPVCDFKHLRFT